MRGRLEGVTAMCSKEDKEAILAQYHASGLRSASACERPPGLPCRKTLGQCLAAEHKCAEMTAVLDVLKAPDPGSLTNAEKHSTGRMARVAGVMLMFTKKWSFRG